MQSKGLSQLTPGFVVYNAAGQQIASAQGGRLRRHGHDDVERADRGDEFYVQAKSPVTTAFGTGAYALTVNLGSTSPPAVAPPNTTKPTATR